MFKIIILKKVKGCLKKKKKVKEEWNNIFILFVCFLIGIMAELFILFGIFFVLVGLCCLVDIILGGVFIVRGLRRLLRRFGDGVCGFVLFEVLFGWEIDWVIDWGFC